MDVDMDMDMDVDDVGAQPIFITSAVHTMPLRGDGPSSHHQPSNHQHLSAATPQQRMGTSMRRGSISMAMSWKNSLSSSFNLLRAGTNTLSSMFSTSPVGNTIFDMLNQSLTTGSFKDLHRIEQTFMQDLTCCGIRLRDLHELMQHVEEGHNVDQGMETDMTLEDDDGWDDDTRTVPDENEAQEEGGMMMGEMDMSERSPHISSARTHDPPMSNMAYPALRSRDSASPRPVSPPTLSVSAFTPTQSQPPFNRLTNNPYEGMRATPLDGVAPPQGVNPALVGTARNVVEPLAPKPFRVPATPNTVVVEEELPDAADANGPLPSFSDVEEYEEVESEVEEVARGPMPRTSSAAVTAAPDDDDDEDDVEVDLTYGDRNDAPTESDSDHDDQGDDDDSEEEEEEEDEDEEDDDDTQPTSSSTRPLQSDPAKPRGKRYPCHIDGCDKVYKNPGGLKYHLAHSHPDPDQSLIPPGLLGRNGKRGKNVPDIYKPYRCMVVTCGKRYKNLNGLKYHLEHHHSDISDDPHKMGLSRVMDKDGKYKWDLSVCYDPLMAKPSGAEKSGGSNKKAAAPKAEPVKVQPAVSTSTRGTKSRGAAAQAAAAAAAAQQQQQQLPPGIDPSSLPPMGIFIPGSAQLQQPSVPVSQAQIQALATAIQNAASSGATSPELANQMLANLMGLAKINNQ